MREYTILTLRSAKDLITEVNKALKLGWVPLGGPFLIHEVDGSKWMQAIVKQTNI